LSAEKRNRYITACLTADEFRQVAVQATRAGLSRSAYARRRLLRKPVQIKITEEFQRKMLRLGRQVLTLEDKPARQAMLTTVQTLIKTLRETD